MIARLWHTWRHRVHARLAIAPSSIRGHHLAAALHHRQELCRLHSSELARAGLTIAEVR